MKKDSKQTYTLGQLKAAIPPECFEASLPRSLSYVVRDIIYTAILVALASKIQYIPSLTLRIIAWNAYMFAQGCVGMGLWILGHECGHGSFSRYNKVNNVVGWFLHSAVLVPFFSWKITHARHHRYTGHITKDTVFSPLTEDHLKTKTESQLHAILHAAEETPIVTLWNLLQQQIIGWQLYLIFNVTAGDESLPDETEKPTWWNSSHFSPSSKLFLPSQKLYVVLSDIGILCTLGCLWILSQHVGYQNVLLLYVGPYFWVHNWLGKSDMV